MRKRTRIALICVFVACLCAVSAVFGFVYGTYIQYNQLVAGDEAVLTKDMLIAQGCVGHKSTLLCLMSKEDLPLEVSTYSAEYKLLHAPIAKKARIIAINAWMLRHTVPDGALASPCDLEKAFKTVAAQKDCAGQ